MNRSEILSRHGQAKITLGISLLFSVGLFVYLSLAGSPIRGAVLGVFVVLAGVWEYRRTKQDLVTTERYEAEAKSKQRRRRR